MIPLPHEKLLTDIDFNREMNREGGAVKPPLAQELRRRKPNSTTESSDCENEQNLLLTCNE